MLRDTAIAWIHANLPHPVFQRDFEKHFDEATAVGLNFYLMIGRGLTTDGKLRLLHFFGGELFIFELTQQQAMGFHLKPGEVMWGTGRSKDCSESIEEPPVTLRDLEIEGSDSLHRESPIIAHVSYDLGSNRDPCVFRLDYDVPGAGSVIAWHYIDGLLELKGRIRCAFSPMELVLSGKNISGPVALFMRLFTLPDSKNTDDRKPISNTAGALVTVSATD
jgi:hypothetical protein